MHWGCLRNEVEWEKRGEGEGGGGEKEETEPGRSHSYATRHDESLSFGDPCLRLRFTRPSNDLASPLFERVQDDECDILPIPEKPRRETGTHRPRTSYLHYGAISRGTLIT